MNHELARPLEAEFDAGSAREFFDRATGSHAKPIPLHTALSNLSEFDPDLYLGRDRDRLIEWSAALVVVDEFDGLRLARTREAEQDLDPLKDRCVRPVSSAFNGGLNSIQANAAVPRPPLHQQHAAGGNAREEGLRGRDLLPGAAEVRRLIDDELVGAHLIERAPGCGGGGGVCSTGAQKPPSPA